MSYLRSSRNEIHQVLEIEFLRFLILPYLTRWGLFYFLQSVMQSIVQNLDLKLGRKEGIEGFLTDEVEDTLLVLVLD